ncbi:hypothetical protein K461DRAFT_289034 [Myriangium duriaei CBS 260.36]|uniref:Uncharacterized protein n=1 Tax=Myriangium duriaei CBS 260.36 TaxID=1168546 RepID=A0A9P4J785_9PEZI|nr:hypothetical protein K461DRAFT_289034 [Myriangium duriaei CBS 260.36]
MIVNSFSCRRATTNSNNLFTSIRFQCIGSRSRLYSQPAGKSGEANQIARSSEQRQANVFAQAPKGHELSPPRARKDPPVLLVGALCFLAIPPLVYFYWQHRDEHMKAKKYAMLKDLQNRAANKA